MTKQSDKKNNIDQTPEDAAPKKAITGTSKRKITTDSSVNDIDLNETDNPDNEKKKPVRKKRSLKKRITDTENPEEAMLQQIPEIIPVLPLRDSVIFNSMVVPLYENREKGILAVEQSLIQSKFIFLVAQKDVNVEDPELKDFYDIGTVGMILRMLKMPDGQLKVLVQGVCRASIKEIVSKDPYLMAKMNIIVEENPETSIEAEAHMRSAREYSEKILQLRGIPVNDIMSILSQVTDSGRMADLIAANMRLNVAEAQDLLECINPLERLRRINKHLIHEVDIADMQARIQNVAREGMDKAQKSYYLREQIKAIRQELGDAGNVEDELEMLQVSIKKAGMSTEAKKEAEKQLSRLSYMGNDSAEASVIRTYLDWLIELPWKKMSRDVLDIKKAKDILDDEHYGLTKVKDRILEYLSVRKLNPLSKGSILCFVGPPGVGKTSLGRSIAHAMGRKFQRVSLGGTRDEAEIRGHRRTYIGAMPGRIIQALKQAGTKNPVILLDEIDKLGNDFRGDPSSALLEALDPEQNVHFSDNYLNVEFDLSKILFLCTANHLENIPPALKDRLEIIRLSGYTEFEKLVIAKRYLLKRQIKDNGLKERDIKFSDNAIRKIIREYTREAGLRNLEREIGTVCRKIARRIAEGKTNTYAITNTLLQEFLGIPRFVQDEREKNLIPGVATGLAWTAVGGEVLHVEVSTMKGKGNLMLTGQLGDVMKESAQAAMSYARTHAKELDIDPEFTEKLDIHVHVPAGATPKDGPSAGVTIVSAMISALTNKSIRGDICMTGEITLRGRILPVGGIKEKILAAVALGLKEAAIPSKNIKDLEDIPKDLQKKITIHPVDTIEELLSFVMVK